MTRGRAPGLVLALAGLALGPVAVRAEEPSATEAGASVAPPSAAAATPTAPSSATPTPAPSPRTRFDRRRWQDLRVHRPVDFDYLRLGMPGGIGLGVRYLGIPGAGFDFAMATLFADTEIQLGVTWYPVTTFRPSRVTPLLRFAYRRLHFLSHADQMLHGFGIEFDENDSVQLVLANTTLQGSFFFFPFNKRFLPADRNEFFLDVSDSA